MYLQHIMRLTPHHAGLLLSIQPAVQIVVAPLAGYLTDRCGAERIATIGIALCGVSLLLAGRLDMATPLWQTVAIFLCGGCGMALFGSPNTVAIMDSVDPPHISQASGLIGTLRTLGMLMNMVIISMTLLAYLGNSSFTPENAPVFIDALQFDFVIFGAFNLLAFALSVARLIAVRKK
jgi:MFS family permease